MMILLVLKISRDNPMVGIQAHNLEVASSILAPATTIRQKEVPLLQIFWLLNTSRLKIKTKDSSFISYIKHGSITVRLDMRIQFNGRTPVFQTGYCKFESCYPLHYANVTQLVEWLVCNQRVGSIPIVSSRCGHFVISFQFFRI